LEAWSHRRKLVASYSGALLQGRRTSDDTPVDVSALADGELDAAGLLSFAGANSVAVAALRGQVNGYDLLQATADEQRILVDAGSLVTVGGKAASRGLRVSSGTPDHGGSLVTNAFGVSDGNPVSIFLRGEHGTYSGVFNSIIDCYFSFGLSGSFGDGASKPAFCHRNGTGAGTLTWIGDFSGAFNSNYLLSIIFDGAGSITLRDGTNTWVISQPAAISFNQIAIGMFSGTSEYTSDTNSIQEMAIWTSDQTANEAAIRSALMA
jgi:hypothetical protein